MDIHLNQILTNLNQVKSETYLFFLVYANLNNFLDTVMKNDDKVNKIYKFMNYELILTNDKVTISDEDEKNFKLIRQTLFDKIGNCFMFLKLHNLYDKFN